MNYQWLFGVALVAALPVACLDEPAPGPDAGDGEAGRDTSRDLSGAALDAGGFDAVTDLPDAGTETGPDVIDEGQPTFEADLETGDVGARDEPSIVSDATVDAPVSDLVDDSVVRVDAEPDGGSRCVDADGDGFGPDCAAGGDCDDTDRFTFPGAAQICDGNDNTCGDAGVPADEADLDGDGFVLCSGFVDWQGDDLELAGGDDCDDAADGVFPGGAGCAQAALYAEDFERDDGGWGRAGEPASWRWGTPAKAHIAGAANGARAWVTSLVGTHLNDERSWLVSPPFDLAALTVDPLLRFAHIRDLEGFDGSWVELSLDGGETWSKLGASDSGSNWYNDFIAQEWDGRSTGWLVSEHVLEGAAGIGEVRVRVAFQADAIDAREGFAVDSVEIVP